MGPQTLALLLMNHLTLHRLSSRESWRTTTLSHVPFFFHWSTYYKKPLKYFQISSYQPWSFWIGDIGEKFYMTNIQWGVSNFGLIPMWVVPIGIVLRLKRYKSFNSPSILLESRTSWSVVLWHSLIFSSAECFLGFLKWTLRGAVSLIRLKHFFWSSGNIFMDKKRGHFFGNANI